MFSNHRRGGMTWCATAVLLLAGCEGVPPATPATAPGPDVICPYCKTTHYAWQTYRHGTPVERRADVMTCPYCRSARENLLRGCDPRATCEACGKNRDRCPICRGSDE